MDVVAILNAIESHAASIGHFDKVQRYESKSAPGNGLVCEIWLDRVFPWARASGLAATSAILVFNVRVRTNAFQEPQTLIDESVLKAVDSLMNAYSGDFTLGGLVRNVELLGESNFRLEARAGYVLQDSRYYRTMDITLPMVVNDAWEQVA